MTKPYSKLFNMDTITFLRQFRIFNYAIFDLAISFIVIFLLAPLLSKIFRKGGLIIPKISWLYLTLPISIAVHLLIGKITPMTKNFIDLNGHYILKIIILILLVLGTKKIRRTNKH